jgi:hypothetical protein
MTSWPAKAIGPALDSRPESGEKGKKANYATRLLRREGSVLSPVPPSSRILKALIDPMASPQRFYRSVYS